MIRLKFIALFAIAAFTMSPALTYAGDAAPKVSYSAKKQGRVIFQKDTQDKAVDMKKDTESFNPADVEPAAGGFDVEETKTKSSLADSIKLPRK